MWGNDTGEVAGNKRSSRGIGRAALFLALVGLAYAAVFAGSLAAQELHVKKNVSVGGYTVSTTDTSIKGARSREVMEGQSGNSVTLRQCDLHRTVTLNDQDKTYFVQDDPKFDARQASAKASTASTASAPTGDASGGGQIDITSTFTDTGERRTLFGFPAKHLKGKITQESSANACTPIHQSFEIDGWYADIGKEAASCPVAGAAAVTPQLPTGQGCDEKFVEHRSGSVKPGYPLSQTITMPSPDGKPNTVSITVSELSKQPQDAELFEVPKDYKQVSSLAEVKGQGATQSAGVQLPAGQAPTSAMPPMSQGQMPQTRQGQAMPPQGMNPPAASPVPSKAAMLGAMMNPAAAAALQQKMGAQAQAQPQMAMAGMGGAQGMQPGVRMPGMPNQAQSAPVAAPQALGPKAPGKIRVGIAPPDAQMGQGSKSGADYSTPIRNAMVVLMSGPAVEIAALDSRIPIQLQAEAQQKECDYVFYSAVAVKHAANTGLGGLFKKAAPIAQMTPMGAMAKGMGGAMAAQAAATMASQVAQQQAMNQLAGFNGEIKSKDDVTIQYNLMSTAQNAPVAQQTLQGKAKSDGEDVLTPLLQQAATTVLTQVTMKK